MKFEKLEIETSTWGNEKGKIKGNIMLRSNDDTSTIWLNLTKEHIKSIFDMIEPQLNEVLKESIQALRNEVNGKEIDRDE